MEQLFYIQSTDRVIGNNAVWWRKNDAGYSDDLSEAGKYNAEQARDRVTDRDIAIPCEVVDAMVRPSVHKHKPDNFIRSHADACICDSSVAKKNS
jgi:hypothetical protein